MGCTVLYWRGVYKLSLTVLYCTVLDCTVLCCVQENWVIITRFKTSPCAECRHIQSINSPSLLFYLILPYFTVVISPVQTFCTIPLNEWKHTFLPFFIASSSAYASRILTSFAVMVFKCNSGKAQMCTIRWSNSDGIGNGNGPHSYMFLFFNLTSKHTFTQINILLVFFRGLNMKIIVIVPSKNLMCYSHATFCLAIVALNGRM